MFRTCLILLEVATSEVLDQYADHVRDLTELYGDEVWFLVYLADCRMRSEVFPRLRRELELEHEERLATGVPSSYNPSKPWDGVFAAATSAKEFWTDEVREKAIMWKCRVKAPADLVSDGTAQPHLLPAAAQAGQSSKRQLEVGLGPGGPPISCTYYRCSREP